MRSVSILSTTGLVTLVICLFFCTELRSVITLAMPIFVVVLSHFMFNVKATCENLLCLVLSCISAMVGIISGNIDFANVIIYYWLAFPLLYLYLCKIEYDRRTISWNLFWPVLCNVVIIVDVLGLFSLLIFGTPDDFGRAYGLHFKGVSGLSMVNGMLSLYYLAKYLRKKANRQDIVMMIVFLMGSVLCFSGLTLLTYTFTLILYFVFSASIRKIIAVIPFVAIIGYLLTKSALGIMEYNINNVMILANEDQREENARKTVMFQRFVTLNEKHPLMILTTGVGTSGYNSRSCFLINKDANNIFTSVLGHHMPKYHGQDIYPLWNNGIIKMYTDGARNKPFSSLISIWAETGFVFFVILSFVWFKRLRFYFIKSKVDSEFLFLFLLNLFVYFLLLTEYWLESSEFLLFIILQSLLIAKKTRIRKLKIQLIK